MAASHAPLERLRRAMQGRQYTIIESIHGGCDVELVVARDTVNERTVVLQFLRVDPEHKDALVQEVLHHRAFKHSHIIELYSVFRIPDPERVVLSMEYGDKGNLIDEIRRHNPRLEEYLVRWYFEQLIIAVDYCHLKERSPRDIKLENIVLQTKKDTEGAIPLLILKLCDIPYSKCASRVAVDVFRFMIESIAHLAPEAIEAKERNGMQSLSMDVAKKCDVWSCGVVLFALVTGEHPFYPFVSRGNAASLEEDYYRVVRNIKNMRYNIPDHVPEGCRDLIKKCLTNSVDRLNVEDVMKHEWLVQHNMGMQQAASQNREIVRVDDPRHMQEVERSLPTTYIQDVINDHLREQSERPQGSDPNFGHY